MKWLGNLWPSGQPRLSKIVCPYCCESLRVEEIYFKCRDISCRVPAAGLPEEAGKRSVFRPKSFETEVACHVETCRKRTALKLCPKCWKDLPSLLSTAEVLTIAGLRGSGKTCYTTGLIRAMRTYLADLNSFRTAVGFVDDGGRNYFQELITQILTTGSIASEHDFSAKVQAKSIQLSVRFPRYHRGVYDAAHAGLVSLVFQDPAGEWFKNFENIHQVNFLAHTRSLMLLVDPFLFPGFKPKVRLAGTPAPAAWPAALTDLDPTTAIETLAQKLRIQMGLGERDLIPKDLAVVITKTDCGVFDDPCELESLPRQKPPFDPGLNDQINQLCQQHLNRLQMGELINKAETNFANVRFFGVSALGTIPRSSGAIDPSLWVPRRVEDPFLWILHQWGLV